MNEIKALKRLLKLLATQTDTVFIKYGCDGYKLHTASRIFSFSENLVSRCVDRKLISVRSDQISIADEGKAVLVELLHPDMEYRSQHYDIKQKSIIQNGSRRQVAVNENESPLSRLYYRRDKSGKSWIDENEFNAGERLRSDFEKSQLQQSISANWEASASSKSRSSIACADISDFAVDARNRVSQSIKFLGPELSGVALDVCCFLKGLETVEKERAWPPRSAKLMLRTALRELVRHYGIKPVCKSKDMQHWGVEGFRPTAFQ